jgi:hypothetical protein
MSTIDRSNQTSSLRLEDEIAVEVASEKLTVLINSVCGFLITLTLYPQTFEINDVLTEDPAGLYVNQFNRLADRLYQNLFSRNILNQNDEALLVFLQYLDREASPDDRITVIELMFKRVWKSMSATLQDQQSLLAVLQLLEMISDY